MKVDYELIFAQLRLKSKKSVWTTWKWQTQSELSVFFPQFCFHKDMKDKVKMIINKFLKFSIHWLSRSSMWLEKVLIWIHIFFLRNPIWWWTCIYLHHCCSKDQNCCLSAMISIKIDDRASLSYCETAFSKDLDVCQSIGILSPYYLCKY